jgi:hypothetical protein
VIAAEIELAREDNQRNRWMTGKDNRGGSLLQPLH